MPLAVGQSLSFYEILGPLGAGAMGEVYRAKDTRLEREVAIKVLPEHFAEDEERLRRFEREAKSLASLNHTNVAQIHGVDQVEDTCFLVLELVPGETLEERIARGALPVEESIDVCRQIAEGLEAAHEAGVVHRDLKPANVRITPEGQVKLLDFGLAKPTRERSPETTTGAKPDSFLMTEEGLVLGTPTYMSPEQARGKPVDRRTDIWAFGCVLYECLTGKRAFSGNTITDVLAAVLEKEPDLSALPPMTPLPLRHLIERCLRKDSRRRLRDIGEARIALEDAADSTSAAYSTEVRVRRGPWVPILVGTTIVALTFAALGWLRSGTAAPIFRTRPLLVSEAWDADPNWSPRGGTIAFVRYQPGSRGIFVVPASGGDPARRIATDEDVFTPCWSPDGATLAYASGYGPGAWVFLAQVHSNSARPQRVFDLNVSALNTSTLSRILGDRPWSEDGERLLVSRADESGQLSIVWMNRAGRSVRVTQPPVGADDLCASLSFDYERIVFERRMHGRGTLHTMPVEGGEPRELLVNADNNEAPAWRPDNFHVVYRSDRTGVSNLWEIDGESGEQRQLTNQTIEVNAHSISGDDRIAFSTTWHNTFLHRLNTDSREPPQQLTAHPQDNFAARPSPSDGDTIAYHSTRTGVADIWLRRDADEEHRPSPHPRSQFDVDWSPDGSRLTFVSDEEGTLKIFIMDRDGSNRRRLVDQPLSVRGSRRSTVIQRWSPGGDRVGYIVNGSDGRALHSVREDGTDPRKYDIKNVAGFDWYLDSHRVVITRLLDGGAVEMVAKNLVTGEERRLFDQPHTEIDVSPDGRSIAFVAGKGHFSQQLYRLRLEPPADADGLPKSLGAAEAMTQGSTRHVHNGGWYPDSRHIVYTQDEDFGDMFELVETGTD